MDDDVRQCNILIVDNDDVGVLNARRALQCGNSTSPVWAASDGIAGLAMLRGTELPQARRLVLLDINMPRMTGLRMLHEIRNDKRLRPTSVVMMSTSNDARDRDEAHRLNCAGYILKPVTFKALVEVMTALARYWTHVEMA